MSATGAAASATKKVGRNDPCPCGSGKKYKHCCQGKDAHGFSPAAAPGSPPSPAIGQRLQALLHAARNYCGARRWAEAIPLFDEIARLDPMRPQAHCDLG